MAKIRLADIAEKAGVSAVTVHNALTGQKGVSNEMRERILTIADELGYRKKHSEERLEHGKTPHIGVIIQEKYLAEYMTFYWKMYQEMALTAQDKNCMLTVEIISHESEKKLHLPKIVKEKRANGLIVIGEMRRPYLNMLRSQAGVPVVFLDFYNGAREEDAVISDNFYGMYLLTEYLFKQGMHRFAYVGSIWATSSIMDRYCGFMKALLAHNETLPKEWLIEDRDEVGQISIHLPEHLPEAFVCNCDLTAGQLILALRERGIRVPEDVSVIGFDNYLYPGFPDLKITTYAVDMKKMAKVALDLVLKHIKNLSAPHRLEIVSGQIVEKESVKLKTYHSISE